MNRRKFFQGLAAAAICANSLLARLTPEAELLIPDAKIGMWKTYAGDVTGQGFTFLGFVHDITFTPSGEIDSIKKSYHDAVKS